MKRGSISECGRSKPALKNLGDACDSPVILSPNDSLAKISRGTSGTTQWMLTT